MMNIFMAGQPINISPSGGGAVAKILIFAPLEINLVADKFLIFFIMKADLIPLLNV